MRITIAMIRSVLAGHAHYTDNDAILRALIRAAATRSSTNFQSNAY